MASCAVTQRVVLRTEATIVSASSGESVRGSTTSTEMPSCSASSAACERLMDEPPGRDHRHVRALAMDARPAERDRLDLVRYVALHRVQRAVLEEDDRVRVVDRGPEQAAHVLGRGGEDDLQPRDVDEPGLELLGVLRSGRPAGAALRADRQRHLDLPAGHRPVLGRLVDELLHRDGEEVLVHDLDHGRMPWIAAPMPAPTIAISEIGVLRTRVGAELVEHALRDAHRPAHLGDVLAHDEDAVVIAQRCRARRAPPRGRSAQA